MTLTAEEQRHVEMTHAWVGLFRRLCKKYNSQHWQLDFQTRQLLTAAKMCQSTLVAAIVREREVVNLGAIHIRRQRVIHVLNDHPAFSKGFAYLARWDDVTVGRSFPHLTFIGHYTPESLAEFENLFARFIKPEAEEKFDLLRSELSEKYNGRYAALSDENKFSEGASCPI
jgi:hypothetical protein